MFESLASCSAAYMPSFGWRKSPRLRGFAFRCSASLNMTGSSTPLQKQMHVFRQFSTDPFCSCDLLDACVAEAIHGTEPPQQQIFPVLTHPRTIVSSSGEPFGLGAGVGMSVCAWIAAASANSDVIDRRPALLMNVILSEAKNL